MKTRQELFDNAWLQFERQGWKRSVNRETETCMYRGPDDCRCGIGASIPDEKYGTWLERQYASDPNVMEAAGIAPGDQVFADKLQECHDDSDDGDPLQENMREFAKEHNLTIPGEQ